MDSLEIIHKVESRVGYTLPERICYEICKHGDNDVQYIIELYGLPTLTSDKEPRRCASTGIAKGIEVTTVLTYFGDLKTRKRIEWSSTILSGGRGGFKTSAPTWIELEEELVEEADRIQAQQREEAEEEIRKILS